MLFKTLESLQINEKNNVDWEFETRMLTKVIN